MQIKYFLERRKNIGEEIKSFFIFLLIRILKAIKLWKLLLVYNTRINSSWGNEYFFYQTDVKFYLQCLFRFITYLPQIYSYNIFFFNISITCIINFIHILWYYKDGTWELKPVFSIEFLCSLFAFEK